MEAKRVSEYYSIKVNDKMKTVLIERRMLKFDNIDRTEDAKKWVDYMNKVIMRHYKTNEWHYLGGKDNFIPEEKERVLTIKIN